MEILIGVFVIVLDLVSKSHAAIYLAHRSIPIIPQVLELTYVQNQGAAWGMFQGGRVIFVVITTVFLLLAIILYIKAKNELRFLSRLILMLLVAGSLGNLIDRLCLGYVRDMIYVSCINFPVFNIADSSIVIGGILLAWETLFRKNGIFDVAEKYLNTKKHSS